LSQLDDDIAAAEDELGGEIAANDPEKKRRIADLLLRLREERSIGWRQPRPTATPIAHSSAASEKRLSGY